MKYFLWIMALALLFSCSPKVVEVAPAVPKNVYEQVEWETGVSQYLLQAIAITESSENDAVVGDGGKSKGRMQINERYRTYYVEKFGEYNPHDTTDAVRLAAKIILTNYQYFNDLNKAIASYRQGIKGVEKYGVHDWYVKKVLKTMQNLIDKSKI